MCVCAYPEISIKTQLEKISKAMHILLILHWVHINIFFQINFYHDLQATFKDAYFCPAKFNVYHQDKPLFLMLTGNDSLERIFSNKSKSWSCRL